ncbi:MAG: histidine phosphatase family protein [Pseudomonadota bacterium]
MTPPDPDFAPPVFARPFFFLRHGETTYNRDRIFQGQVDSPLSERGVAQAREAAARLVGEPIRRIVASPLSRARLTAEAAGRALGVAVETDDDLKECALGVHEDQPHASWPLAKYWTGELAPEGGESFFVFRRRVVRAMARITGEGDGILIVAHGGLWHSLRSIYAMETGIAGMPNALPLALTPGAAWDVRVIGEMRAAGAQV